MFEARRAVSGFSLKWLPRFSTVSKVAVFFSAVFAFSCFLTAAGKGKSGGKGKDKGGDVTADLRRGISAWSYKQDKAIVAKIKAYNKKAKPENRFRYFFPYTGSLSFSSKGKGSIYYDPKKDSFYSRPLRKDVKMFPIVDARDDKKKFRDWSDAQYKKFAGEVADKIIKDRSAAGAQVDIEPFHPSHLPFYKHLKEALNAKGKILTMFVGAKKDPLLAEVFNSCDILVLSGYDGSGENPGPNKYKKVLTRNLARLRRVAKATGGKYMVGIPAAASWGEYEYVNEKNGKKNDTGHKQVEYVKASLEALKTVEDDPNYLGIALWVMSRIREKDDPKAKGKQPNYIREDIWKLLEKH